MADKDPRFQGLGPLKSTKWAVYGRTRSGKYCSITRDFMSEEAATVYLVERAMGLGPLDAVVVRVDKYHLLRDLSREYGPGKYKDVPSVVLRVGDGKGWWE